MDNIQKIKSIFLDYAEGLKLLVIREKELDIIAKRITVEVMGEEDDDFYANLTDLTKK